MAVQRVVSSRFTGNPGGTGLYQFKIADRDTAITPLVAGETVTANGTLQVETATVVGSIPAAVQQVETGTVVGTVTGSGNATVIVTAAGMPNSPKTIPVAVVNTDTASIVAGKIRTALAADTDVSGFFTVGGTGADVVLTAKAAAANDGTMNISIDNGTCTGLTTEATSANTTAGVASGAGTAAVVVTAAGLTSGSETFQVPVADGDTATNVATKIRAALAADSGIITYFSVSGTGANVVLTAVTPGNNGIAPANDSTLNISIANGTCSGLTTEATSTNTTAGVTGGIVQDWTTAVPGAVAAPTAAPYLVLNGVRFYAGAGVPNLPQGTSAAPNVGDVYLRSDGAVGSTFYRCTVGGTSPTWAAIL